MISKQPRLDSGIDGSASIGSAWSRRGTLDLNQAFSDNAAFRLNLMGKKPMTPVGTALKTNAMASRHRWPSASIPQLVCI
jgi:catecholate siderophore receptor